MCRENDHLFQKNKSILIAEDNIESLDLYKNLLTSKLPSCKVYSYDKINDEFYKLIKYNDIDLFIMDVRLAGSDARDITEKIIKNDRGSMFLFISGYDYNIRSFKKFKGKCIYDFMAKPFEIDAFLSCVVTLLNISTTYKTFVESLTSIDSTRSYYMNQIKKDKQMIECLRKDLFKDLPISC
jgi:DNA-binding NtrC family response regulator